MLDAIFDLSMLQDSDLNGVVAIRYTGGARMLLLIELGRHKSKMRIKVIVCFCQPHRDMQWTRRSAAVQRMDAGYAKDGCRLETVCQYNNAMLPAVCLSRQCLCWRAGPGLPAGDQAVISIV